MKWPPSRWSSASKRRRRARLQLSVAWRGDLAGHPGCLQVPLGRGPAMAWSEPRKAESWMPGELGQLGLLHLREPIPLCRRPLPCCLRLSGPESLRHGLRLLLRVVGSQRRTNRLASHPVGRAGQCHCTFHGKLWFVKSHALLCPSPSDEFKTCSDPLQKD